ncbi:MAG: DUF3107 domain-containing protein [Acidimicrobiales bacterium]
MEIRIGVIHTNKEIEVELPDDADLDKLAKQVDKALETEGAVLWLTDRRGRRVGVPSSRLAYVEIARGEERRVGFGAP